MATSTNRVSQCHIKGHSRGSNPGDARLIAHHHDDALQLGARRSRNAFVWKTRALSFSLSEKHKLNTKSHLVCYFCMKRVLVSHTSGTLLTA
jgi:hypothetical protein